MKIELDLKNYFIIATPSLKDINFSKSVIYIEEHSDEGSIGLIINKPLQINLGTVLGHLKLSTQSQHVANQDVLMGGPIGQDQGFVLHRSTNDDTIELSSSKELLRLISKNQGPTDYLVTLGYSGWEPGQLSDEILQNDWLTVPAAPHILFDTPIHLRWEAAIKLLGVNPHNLSDDSGHA